MSHTRRDGTPLYISQPSSVVKLHTSGDIPGGGPASHAATWEGPVRNLTELEALIEVLDHVWTRHLLVNPDASGRHVGSDQLVFSVRNSGCQQLIRLREIIIYSGP